MALLLTLLEKAAQDYCFLKLPASIGRCKTTGQPSWGCTRSRWVWFLKNVVELLPPAQQRDRVMTCVPFHPGINYIVHVIVVREGT